MSKRNRGKHKSSKSDRLRVLHINTLLHGGGTDDQCLKIALGLHQLGQEVWIAGPGDQALSTTIADLKIPHHITPHEGWLKLRYIFNCARFIRSQKIEIVHGHHGRDYWPTILAANLSGARPKIVLSRHMPSSPRSGLSKSLLLTLIDRFVAVSEFVARVLKEGHSDPESPNPERHFRSPMRGNLSKIRVAYGGIDTGKFKPTDGRELRRSWGLTEDQFVFGVVGGYQLPRGKGQRDFLAAAAKIHLKKPNARFLIIGRGSMSKLLMEDIHRLGLEGKAMLTPYSNDVPQVMNTLDCLVHPAIGIEALGLVVCEAHACGRPVIATALDGIPEAFAVGGLGRLITPESVDEMAAAMVGQIESPRLGMEERQRLHRRVDEEFSVEAATKRMMKIYQELLRVDVSVGGAPIQHS